MTLRIEYLKDNFENHCLFSTHQKQQQHFCFVSGKQPPGVDEKEYDWPFFIRFQKGTSTNYNALPSVIVQT